MVWRAGAALLLACVAAACSALPPRLPAADVSGRAGVASPVPTTSGEAPASGGARPPASTALRRVSAPQLGPFACDVPSSSWSGEVSLRPEGEPFATLSRAPVSLALRESSGEGGGRLAIEARGLRVAFTVDRPVLFARSATVFSGLLTPRADVRLGYVGAGRSGAIAFTLDLSDLFDEPSRFETVAPCSQVSLNEQRFEVPARPRDATQGLVYGPAPLALEPGRAPVAKLKKGRQLRATPLERRDGFIRVWIEEPRFVGAAWVESAHFNAIGYGVGYGTLGHGAGVARGRSEWQSCARALPLFGTVGGEIVAIGELARGARFRALDGVDPGLVGVELDVPWLSLAPSAQVVVEREALARCKKAEPRAP